MSFSVASQYFNACSVCTYTFSVMAILPGLLLFPGILEVYTILSFVPISLMK